MIKVYKLLLFIFLILSVNVSLSQDNKVRFNEISEEQKVKFKEQVQQNIKNLGSRLKILANEENKQVQQNIITAQLDYFIEGAKFQTGTISKKDKTLIANTYTVREYLTNKVAKYKKTSLDIIEIEFASFSVGDKLKPVKGKLNTYYFEFEFTQIFRRGKKGKRKNKEGLKEIEYSYVDKTIKTGKVFVKKKNTVMGSVWKLYFGDILVKDVKI